MTIRKTRTILHRSSQKENAIPVMPEWRFDLKSGCRF